MPLSASRGPAGESWHGPKGRWLPAPKTHVGPRGGQTGGGAKLKLTAASQWLTPLPPTPKTHVRQAVTPRSLAAWCPFSSSACKLTAHRNRPRLTHACFDLPCSMSSSIGLILGSQKNISCNFKGQTPGDPEEAYTGTMTTVGIDIGVTTGGAMILEVFASTNRYAGIHTVPMASVRHDSDTPSRAVVQKQLLL
jgi:Protein of unknown function (DUF992)